VEVFLQTGDRSPLSYFMRPFTDYFARSMRED
jgi:HlyD family secretion protein